VTLAFVRRSELQEELDQWINQICVEQSGKILNAEV
jgi:hypothetical protein